MPDWASEIRRRIEPLRLSPTREMEIAEEISQHLEDRYARSRGLGLSDDEARARAWSELDESDDLRLALTRVEPPAPAAPPPLGSTAVRTPLRMFPRDLIHAVRTLARARAYSFVCIASLGLGIGTVMAMLILMRGLSGTPAGVDPNGLVELVTRPTGQLPGQPVRPVVDTWSWPDFVDVRDGVQGVTLAASAFGESMLRLPGGGATPVPTMFVTSNYFPVVGVRLARGPGFPAARDQLNVEPVVVIGQLLWERRFGSDPSIVGRTITLNQVPHVVVGIAPRGYKGHFNQDGAPETQVWAPLLTHPRVRAAGQIRFARDVDWLNVIGRLSPGADLAPVRASVASVTSGLAERYPDSNRFKAGAVERYTSVGAQRRNEYLVILAMFLSSAGLVLLIVCLNVSGMMLVRSATRQRELAIRLALGASRGRLMQYLLSEAVVLALLGGALSATLLFGVPAAISWWFGVWDPDLDPLLPDGWTVLQGVALCFITSLVFGLLPAARFSRPSLVSSLKDESSGGRRAGRFHRLTASIQAGIAVPFIIIGGVKLDQARVTQLADLGFAPEGLYAAPLKTAAARTIGQDDAGFLRRVEQRLAQAPGVTSIAFADGLPLDFDSRLLRVSREDDATPVPARVTRATAGYLETLGVRILRGRAIEAGDTAAAERVVVLSEPLAARLFGTRDPLGARLITFAGNERTVVTVIGVAADLVGDQMGNPRPQLFVPLAQQPTDDVLAIVRGPTTDASIRTAFEAAITDLDADYVLTNVISGTQLRAKSKADLRVHSIISSGAAVIALILAALGVYGVIGFMVATRTREIGVRVALGATRRQVVSEVLADSLRLVGPGVAVGLLAGAFWVRELDPSWYPLGGVEPLVYAIAAATAFVVALIASGPSARRAAAVEPLAAMRAE